MLDIDLFFGIHWMSEKMILLMSVFFFLLILLTKVGPVISSWMGICYFRADGQSLNSINDNSIFQH